MGSFPIGDYRIPIKLKARCRTCINQILQYTDWNQEAENDYIRCLQAEELMEKHFPNELQQFKKKYQPNKPQNAGLQTPLYAVIIKRRTSSAFAEALYEYNYLFCLSEEYYRIIQPKPNLSSTVVVTRQSSVPTANFSNTIHGYGEQQNRKTDGGLDAKFLREENERLKKQVEDQGEDIKRLNNQRKENAQTIDELRNRLSGLASKKLTQGNPDITDLSDKNRPTRLVEEFHKIYDDEWTNALEALSHAKKDTSKNTEEEAIGFLREVVKAADEYCTTNTNRQTDNLRALWQACMDNPLDMAFSVQQPPSSKSTMSELALREFKEQRKGNHKGCLKHVIENFKNNVLKMFDFYNKRKTKEVDAYIDKCIECLWRMKIQDPPMVLKWPEPGQKIDKEMFKEYCRRNSDKNCSMARCFPT